MEVMPVPYHIERKSSRFRPIKVLSIIGVGIILGGLISLVIRAFFYEPINIESSAMSPNLKQGVVYMVNKFSKDYLIGDMILCELETGIIVSRIMGKPGDRIEIRDKILYRNGDRIPPELYPILHSDDRPPLPSELTKRDNMAEIRIPENHFFLLGDNRDESMDSRILGPLSQECLIGRFSP